MSQLKCPQCGDTTRGASNTCPRCRYTSAVCPADASAGHRGIDPFWWLKIAAIPMVVGLIVVLSAPASKSSSGPDRGGSGQTPSGSGGGPGTNASGSSSTPKPGQLQILFAERQSFEGMELFVDGKVHSFVPNGLQTVLPLPEGEHIIAVRIRGEQLFYRKKTVKPAEQGATVLQVGEILVDPGAPGALVMEMETTNSTPGKNLELFIDGKLRETFAPNYFEKTYTLKIAAGEHAIAFKKHGIEIYAEKVEVKKPADGKTFKKIALPMTGTALLKTSKPIDISVEVWVSVDSQKGQAKQWPVGTTSLEITAEVGTRVIEVYLTKPGPKDIFKSSVLVEPGKQTVVSVPG